LLLLIVWRLRASCIAKRPIPLVPPGHRARVGISHQFNKDWSKLA
jgi:hypothetical protein